MCELSRVHIIRSLLQSSNFYCCGGSNHLCILHLRLISGRPGTTLVLEIVWGFFSTKSVCDNFQNVHQIMAAVIFVYHSWWHMSAHVMWVENWRKIRRHAEMVRLVNTFGVCRVPIWSIRPFYADSKSGNTFRDFVGITYLHDYDVRIWMSTCKSFPPWDVT